MYASEVWGSEAFLLYFFAAVAFNICLAFFQLLFAFAMLAIFHTKNMREIYFENGIYKSSCCVLSLIMIVVVYRLLFGYFKSHIYDLKSYTWIFFIYDIAGICLIAWLQTQLLRYGSHRSKENLFFILIILGATFLMIIGSIKSAEKRAELEMLGFKNKLLEDNYKEIQSMYQNYACSFHDMKNHLIILENYCRAGETEKAIRYIEKIREPIQTFKHYFKSGNEVLDIILNYKLSEAERKGIYTQVIMEAAGEIRLEGCDLCAILSNLLDNAIEACDLTEHGEKWVHVLVKRLGDIVVINVSNSYDTRYKKESEHTTRKGLHGYGLKSVEAKVKRYGGEMKWGYENNRFAVTITFF